MLQIRNPHINIKGSQFNYCIGMSAPPASIYHLRNKLVILLLLQLRGASAMIFQLFPCNIRILIDTVIPLC